MQKKLLQEKTMTMHFPMEELTVRKMMNYPKKKFYLLRDLSEDDNGVTRFHHLKLLEEKLCSKIEQLLMLNYLPVLKLLLLQAEMSYKVQK